MAARYREGGVDSWCEGDCEDDRETPTTRTMGLLICLLILVVDDVTWATMYVDQWELFVLLAIRSKF